MGTRKLCEASEEMQGEKREARTSIDEYDRDAGCRQTVRNRAIGRVGCISHCRESTEV